MVKKKVPEWLNSTMWSTPPPHPVDDRLLRHSPAITISPAKTEPPLASAASRHDPSPPPASPAPSPSPRDPRNGSTVSGGGENGASVGPSPEEISRQAQLASELSKKVINLKEIRSMALQSLPDAPGIRSTVWKLLLGYLPSDRSLWLSELAKKRSQYKRYKEELLMSPSEITRRLAKSKGCGNDELKSESRCMLVRSKITDEDHPLSLGQASIWNKYFQDSDIIEQIDRDVKSTHPDVPFFSNESSLGRSNQESMKNILMVFAKLNPSIRYVQGMNEILAPIFYVFRNDPDEDNSAHAESDAFFCFVELLSGFRDIYRQQLDNSVAGIRSAITRLSQLLKEHDDELWRHLEITTKVNPQFYAVRWIALVLTQEFSLYDSLHIWDALLSDPEGPQEALLRICCGMLILVRRRLITGDFTSNLMLLHHYPPTSHITHLLYFSNKLRSKVFV